MLRRLLTRIHCYITGHRARKNWNGCGTCFFMRSGKGLK